jgi:hypothetical protein
MKNPNCSMPLSAPWPVVDSVSVTEFGQSGTVGSSCEDVALAAGA